MTISFASRQRIRDRANFLCEYCHSFEEASSLSENQDFLSKDLVYGEVGGYITHYLTVNGELRYGKCPLFRAVFDFPDGLLVAHYLHSIILFHNPLVETILKIILPLRVIAVMVVVTTSQRVLILKPKQSFQSSTLDKTSSLNISSGQTMDKKFSVLQP
jgi:hypothetical protein